MTDATHLMDIPSAVQDQARFLLENYEGELVYIGPYQDHEAYRFRFSENMNTGFPIVILYQPEADIAYEVPPYDALDIITEIYNKE